MASYPLPTIACTVDSTGISGPDVSQVLASITASVQSIYGSDTYLEADSKDGNFLAVFAQAQADSNAATIATVNQYNPQTAVGTALDAANQLNGIERLIISKSTVIVTCVGTVGLGLANAVVKDANSNLWNLPALVTIPPSGTIDVTATAQQPGAITAVAGSVNTPYTVILGWQSVTNAEAAVPGAPVEVDGAFRSRQQISVASQSESMLDSLLEAVAAVPGVTRSTIYENKTRVTDANGQPGTSICAVFYGGDVAAVAAAVQSKKAPGVGSYGIIAVPMVDQRGVPITINIMPLQLVSVYAAITIKPLAGYTSAVGAAILTALAAAVSALGIGGAVYQLWAQGIASYVAGPQPTFVIQSFYLGLAANPAANGDLALFFTQAASMTTDQIALTVLA